MPYCTRILVQSSNGPHETSPARIRTDGEHQQRLGVDSATPSLVDAKPNSTKPSNKDAIAKATEFFTALDGKRADTAANIVDTTFTWSTSLDLAAEHEDDNAPYRKLGQKGSHKDKAGVTPVLACAGERVAEGGQHEKLTYKVIKLGKLPKDLREEKSSLAKLDKTHTFVLASRYGGGEQGYDYFVTAWTLDENGTPRVSRLLFYPDYAAD